MDGVFLAVTQITGEVKVMKMPPILNPLEKQDAAGADGVASRDGIGSQAKPGSKQEAFSA